MTVEQFKLTLSNRMNSYKGLHEQATIHLTADEINRMTGGAFYASVAKLPDDYEFPQ